MGRKRKTYEELQFSDDFMFCNVLVENLDLCKELLELILSIKIEGIELAETQKTIRVSYDSKGVRFDVYTVDDANTVYDIEMQSVIAKDLPKRTRYYQGAIDSKLINRGEEYTKLKKSYIIFICKEVQFEGNYPIYTFENMCLEDPSIRLNDEATKVIINANGKRDHLSENLKAFLDYIRDNVTNSDFTRKLQSVVDASKRKEKWRDAYMTLEMKIKEERAEAHEEGKIEGKIEGRIEGRRDSIKVTKLFFQGKTMEEIVALTEISRDEVEQIIEELKKD